jgi:hypothetical protein
MFFGGGKDAQGRRVGGIPPSLDIELLSEPADILRLVVDDWKHPAKEEQVAGLHCFDVRAKRRRRCWELNAQVLQPAFCATWLGIFRAYHLPACAPPSTCSTSPVT